jgi:hypothetical protein
MSNLAWQAFLTPFAAVVLLAVVVRPLADLIRRLMPDGKLRRFLFKRIS